MESNAHSTTVVSVANGKQQRNFAFGLINGTHDASTEEPPSWFRNRKRGDENTFYDHTPITQRIVRTGVGNRRDTRHPTGSTTFKNRFTFTTSPVAMFSTEKVCAGCGRGVRSPCTVELFAPRRSVATARPRY